MCNLSRPVKSVAKPPHSTGTAPKSGHTPIRAGSAFMGRIPTAAINARFVWTTVQSQDTNCRHQSFLAAAGAMLDGLRLRIVHDAALAARPDLPEQVRDHRRPARSGRTRNHDMVRFRAPGKPDPGAPQGPATQNQTCRPARKPSERGPPVNGPARPRIRPTASPIRSR